MVIPQNEHARRGSKRFYWDLVLNNYTLEDCECVKAIFSEFSDSYIIGKEKGKSGTPHLQMMIKLKKGQYKSFLLGLFKFTCVGKRISIREGRNIMAMKDYCLKDGDIYAKHNLEAIKAPKKARFKNDEEIGKYFRDLIKRTGGSILED